jgi:disulfide bond formation protein DsbB
MTDTSPPRLTLWTLLAFLVAAAAVAGSLWMSLGMDLLACPLCYYQRTFAMAVLGILTVGLIGGVRPSSRISLLALPAAAGGLGVAGWHVYLEVSGKLECPLGFMGIGTAPQQSLAGFVILTLILAIDICGCCGGGAVGESRGSKIPACLIGAILGAGFAYGCIKSMYMPPLPAELTTGEPKICRKPAAPPSQP